MSGSGNQPLPAKEQQLFRCVCCGVFCSIWTTPQTRCVPVLPHP